MSQASQGNDVGLGAMIATLSLAVFVATQIRLFQTLMDSSEHSATRRPLTQTAPHAEFPATAEISASEAASLPEASQRPTDASAPDDVSMIVSAWQMRDLGPRTSLAPRRAPRQDPATGPNLALGEAPDEAGPPSLTAPPEPDEEFHEDYLALVEQLCAPDPEDDGDGAEADQRGAGGSLLNRLFRRPLLTR